PADRHAQSPVPCRRSWIVEFFRILSLPLGAQPFPSTSMLTIMKAEVGMIKSLHLVLRERDN
ncbi:hypothetical protein, partial [Actinoplanes octamycinicus]|uniref:hypothetical protein n=1 Tax=Actinoplanes octamycinicus TaxID=135948 RepID=UPI001944B47F